jgi:hypothetical protein
LVGVGCHLGIGVSAEIRCLFNDYSLS